MEQLVSGRPGACGQRSGWGETDSNRSSLDANLSQDNLSGEQDQSSPPEVDSTMKSLEQINSALLGQHLADAGVDRPKQAGASPANPPNTPNPSNQETMAARAEQQAHAAQSASTAGEQPSAKLAEQPISFSKPSSPKQARSANAPASGGGLFGWLSDNEFLSRMAEKAISSVDSVITTLDPGMKEVLCAYTRENRLLAVDVLRSDSCR